MSAILTSVRWPSSLTMMLRGGVTRRAMNAVWIETVYEPFETRDVIRKLPLKLHDRIGAVRRSASDWIVAIRFAHALKVAHGSTSVKGRHAFAKTVWRWLRLGSWQPPANRSVHQLIAQRGPEVGWNGVVLQRWQA